MRSFDALHRANPRGRADFAASVEAAAALTRTRIATGGAVPRRRRRRALPLSAAALAATGAVVAVLVSGGSAPGPTGVADAAAAMRKAVTLTAASAERSGTALVRITHDGGVWAQTTIRWNHDDISVLRDAPSRPGKDFPMLVVGGVLYSHEPGVNRWVALDPAGIDPGSGTTPDEYLAATREDVGGTSLRRITGAMSGLETTRQDDGSTVYSGTAAAGDIARETGSKEGQAIRVLPFGFVAHDDAADPASQLATAITVGADGVLRRIEVTWGTWRYTVSYDGLGATPAPAAPADALTMEQWRRELRGR